MASLTAMHLVRKGSMRDVPDYIADLWWRVGEAAVSWTFAPDVDGVAERNRRRRVVNSWLMLSWVYDPVRLGDNAAYFSEFTKHTDDRRQGAITYAYWLVTEPGADDSVRIYDILVQMLVGTRLPEHWFVSYANWQMDRINDFLDQGFIPTTESGFTLGDRTIEIAMGSAGQGMETITATERQ
ncbi:MAG TPA: hypothetical protein VMO47_18185, partial [Rhodothermales bacterium]|nr:hypothetical protein [Rhodothermales bacterium]